MHGVINVLKHANVTSHDVVAMLRKILQTKKVGHTGTLDPDAVGVLPICVGKATRLVEYLTSTTKVYRAELCFGCETNTQDSSGTVTKRTDLPNIDEQQFRNILQQFTGDIEQVPPMFSAIKVNGQPLYKLARQGETIEVKPRKVTIKSMDLLHFNKDKALIEVTCGKGTYIRSLCQDLGRAVNSSAYMSFLLRTQSGNFSVDNAFTVEELRESSPEQFLIRPADALDWPELCLNDSKLITRISNGNSIPIKLLKQELKPDESYKVLDEYGELLAIGAIQEEIFKPNKVFR